MVAFRNAVAGTSVTNWRSNGNNAIAFGRGTWGYLVINHEAGSITQTFQTSLPPARTATCSTVTRPPVATAASPTSLARTAGFGATVGAGDGGAERARAAQRHLAQLTDPGF